MKMNRALPPAKSPVEMLKKKNEKSSEATREKPTVSRALQLMHMESRLGKRRCRTGQRGEYQKAVRK